MNKTKIEWCDYTINPVKGLCPVGCPYCYARAMYKRFKRDESLSYHDEVFKGVHSLRNPSRIFVGSTIDLFHDKTSGLIPRILEHVRHSPWHTFIFLTKCSENLIKFSPFPDNCWVGVSLPLQRDKYGQDFQVNRFLVLEHIEIIKAKVKFISFEPLLNPLCIGFNPVWWAEKFKIAGINWVIVGQQTPVRKSTMPKIEWIEGIIQTTDQEGIPVFLKNNLYELFELQDIPNGYDVPKWAHANHGINVLRQEWPEVKNDSVIR